MPIFLRRHNQRINRVIFVSLPVGRTGEEPVPVTDRTSGPGAPDVELIWFPLTVFDDKFAKPPPGTHGVTLVRRCMLYPAKIQQLLTSCCAGCHIAAPREQGDYHVEVAQRLGCALDRSQVSMSFFKYDAA